MRLSTPNGASADDSVARIETTDLRRHITGHLLFLHILGDVLGGIYVLVRVLAATLSTAL